MRKRTSALLLFLVAPFIAEYLLGDLPLKLLPAMIVLAPLYGGGALLIREVVRGTRRGWPAMLLLGAAYAMLEEGLITQSLFNPDYLGLHEHFLAPAHIAWLGTGGWWVMLMFNVHTFWSMGVSIALVEALTPETAYVRWLGRAGEWAVSAVFSFGVAANTLIGWKQNHFYASVKQLIVAAGLVAAFVLLASFAKGPVPTRVRGQPISPWITGGMALALGSVIRLTPPRWGWGAAGVMVGIDLLFLGLVFVLVRGSRWTLRQTFGLAAGGALAYGLYAFTQAPVTGGTRASALVSHIVFLVLALWLILAGVRRTDEVPETSELPA